MKCTGSFLLLAALTCAPACSHHSQRAPALSNPAPQQPVEQKKNFLTRTADATWNAVSAPVRLITPQKKPPAPAPEAYQAPEAIIMIPQAEGGEGLLGVASQPATTQPK